MTLVLLARHGLTAGTGTVLTGRTPGVGLDDRGVGQAEALAARLSAARLDAIVTSPLLRCRQTAEKIAAAMDGHAASLTEDPELAEVGYGDWTGKPIKRLAKDPMWRVVQVHPSAVQFPGPGGESMPQMQRRAVAAVRKWNERVGPRGAYLICSHGDVIKAVIADSLGMHLDMFQRIQVDPCSLSVIRYTPLRPFLVRMNDTGGDVTGLVRADSAAARAHGGKPPPAGAGHPEGDAVIGGGAGG